MSEQSLPIPLVPAEVDLRDIPCMPVNVAKFLREFHRELRNSDVMLAELMLNTTAWHQLPAGSLPTDDEQLSHYSTLSHSSWLRVRSEVLNGWTLCSDGRLHHSEVAGLVLKAWKKKRSTLARIARRMEVSSHAWAKLRSAVFERDGYLCQYCRVPGKRLECDHVVPVSRKGRTVIENLITACFTCNRCKGSKLVEEFIA